MQRNFLLYYKANNDPAAEPVHPPLIEEMCAENRQSLPVSYLHLSHDKPVLAIWLADVPKAMLEMFDEVAISYNPPASYSIC